MTFDPPVGTAPTSDPDTVTLETNQVGRDPTIEAGKATPRRELEGAGDPSAWAHPLAERLRPDLTNPPNASAFDRKKPPNQPR
jgi:hypothetical protein